MKQFRAMNKMKKLALKVPQIWIIEQNITSHKFVQFSINKIGKIDIVESKPLTQV
jgi:hypothetical protein